MERIIGAVLLGVAGCATLLWLGIWQIQRLEWKQAILTEIETRIAADPVPLPDDVAPGEDEYLPVTARGIFGTPPIRVLVSVKQVGAGCRIIQPFESGGRRVLVDRGFVRQERCEDGFAGGTATITGNLHWTDEVDGFTPVPEADWREGGLWFARDVPAMAVALGTEPVLIIAREDTGEGIRPLPVGTVGIPNDHLQYAITWFSLALIWAGMTGLLLWRISRRTGRDDPDRTTGA